MSPNKEQHFINRLKQHPKLLDQMEALLNVVENSAGDCTKADDTELYVIEELRKWVTMPCIVGQIQLLTKRPGSLREQQPELHGNGTKVFWPPIFGEISAIEHLFRGSGQL